MPIALEIMNPVTAPGWDDLVRPHPAGSIFHTSGWAEALSESYGYTPRYFVAMDGGALKVLIPLMEVKSALTGNRGVSLPFSDYCDPVMPEGMPYPAVMDRLVEEGKAAGWKSIELRCGTPLFGDVVPSFTYLHHVLALTGDEERLFSALRSSTQRNIRKAEKEGVRTVISGSLEAVEEFYRLNCLTRRDHGLPPQPFRFFRNLHRRVLSKDRGFVALASCGGAGIAASLFLHFGDKAFYKYGASDRKFQHLRANNLLMWEGIRWFCRNGFKSLCFGRTEPDNEGLRRFKTGWGGEESTLLYYTYDIRKCGYVGGAPRVSGFHNRIFRNLPIGVSKVIGSALYKHMG